MQAQAQAFAEAWAAADNGCGCKLQADAVATAVETIFAKASSEVLVNVCSQGPVIVLQCMAWYHMHATEMICTYTLQRSLPWFMRTFCKRVAYYCFLMRAFFRFFCSCEFLLHEQHCQPSVTRMYQVCKFDMQKWDVSDSHSA